MTASRSAAYGDPPGIDLEPRGIRLDPADTVIDIDEAARIGVGAMPEIERDNDAADMAGIPAKPCAVFEIAALPATAMQIDQARKGAGIAAGHKHACDQRAIAMTQIAMVSHSGREDLRPRHDRIGHLGGTPLGRCSLVSGVASAAPLTAYWLDWAPPRRGGIGRQDSRLHVVCSNKHGKLAKSLGGGAATKLLAATRVLRPAKFSCRSPTHTAHDPRWLNYGLSSEDKPDRRYAVTER